MENRNKIPRLFFQIINFSVFVIVILMVLDFWPNSITKVHIPVRVRTLVTNYKNYFLDVKVVENVGMVVNSTNCQIPDFNPWDPTIAPYFKKTKPPTNNCTETYPNWTFKDGNELVMSEEVMKSRGYVSKNISCCYKVVKRTEQPRDNYTRKADRLLSFSSCTPIVERRTRISGEFIEVKCFEGAKASERMKNGGENKLKTVYQGYWAFAQAANSIKTHNKISYWQKRSKLSMPPNILVIGIDSTSRLNFRRHMNKTRNTLEKLGAVEMVGYTKAGMNTFPNYVALFYGYSMEELSQICYFNSSIKLDDCPSIWQRFDEANYLTAHTEDVPQYGGFNYLKTGFVKQPVDFYPRPLFLAAKNNEQISCLGALTSDEAIISYLEGTMDLAEKQKTPIFSFSWSTKMSHDNVNGIQRVDDVYSRFLKRLEDKGQMENTILFFMGDHGYRWGSVRNTLIGYYEDKLPNMWIRIPPAVHARVPGWLHSLKANANRLTSPFTFYWTLNFILGSFTPTASPPSSSNNETGEMIHRGRSYNFFEPVPEESSCGDLGIPEIYCPCFPINKVNLNDYILTDAALASIGKVNSDLASVPQCSVLKLGQITSGAVVNKTLMDQGFEMLRYIVGFIALPGDLLLEAEINYFPRNNTFSSDVQVQRANQINQTDIKCIKDLKLELFCYCNFPRAE